MDYQKKLYHLIQYLHVTYEMALYLNYDDINIIHWWVDASYGVHHDTKDHIGATMSIGRGCGTSMSKKQKINTYSSTQWEAVGLYDTPPQMM